MYLTSNIKREAMGKILRDYVVEDCIVMLVLMGGEIRLKTYVTINLTFLNVQILPIQTK